MLSLFTFILFQIIAGLLTHALGVTETRFSNLKLFVIICAFSTLLPLPLLPYWVPGTPEEEAADAAAAAAKKAKQNGGSSAGSSSGSSTGSSSSSSEPLLVAGGESGGGPVVEGQPVQ